MVALRNWRSWLVAFATLPLSLGCAFETSDGPSDELDEDALDTVREAVSNAQAIGVIPISNSSADQYFGTVCPRETTAAGSPTAELVGFHMDDEDDNNATVFTNGWELPQTTVKNYFFAIGSSETRMRFCRVDGSAFRAKTVFQNPAAYYAVLSLGAGCPTGSNRVGIFIDNEDDDNANSGFGTLSPNSLSGNATLFFCLFQTATTANLTWPALGAPYAVFHDWEGSQPNWVISKHIHKSDDEDDNNQNHWVQGDSAQISAFSKMVELSINTKFDFARVQ